MRQMIHQSGFSTVYPVFFFGILIAESRSPTTSLRGMSTYLTKWCLFTALLACVAIWGACKEGAKEKGQAEQILKTAEGGDFRGVNIGDNPEDVKRAEDAESVYSMPDELVYRIPPSTKDSTWYEISYNFNNAGLYDISLDIFPKTDSAVRAMKNDFIAYYLHKYGECRQNEGYCEWRAMTENGHIVSITLADTILRKTRPCLQVNFNESEH